MAQACWLCLCHMCCMCCWWRLCCAVALGVPIGRVACHEFPEFTSASAETVSLGVRVIFILYFLPQAENSPMIWQFLANKQHKTIHFSNFRIGQRFFKFKSTFQIFHFTNTLFNISYIHIVYHISQQSRRADRLDCCKRNMHANTWVPEGYSLPKCVLQVSVYVCVCECVWGSEQRSTNS